MIFSIISIIAINTGKEALRSRSTQLLLGIFLAGCCAAPIVGWISATDGTIVTTDIIFSLHSIIGVLVAVATGTALMHSEIQQRTLYTVLTRPMARWQFVVGKFTGLCGALLIGQMVMLIIAFAFLFIGGYPTPAPLIIAGALNALEACVMAGVSLMWTTLSSPLLAAVLSLATYAIGHAVHNLPQLIGHLEGAQATTAIILASLVPDLGSFAYRNEAVYGIPPGSSEILALVYGGLWIALFLCVTIGIVERKHL